MNLLLLQPEQLINDTLAQVKGRQAEHIIHVIKAQSGESLKAGLINGQIGQAIISSIKNGCVELQLQLHSTPPPPLPLTLVLALPRPKMLKRILQSCATLGIKEIFIINSYRVEKSYWQTPWLHKAVIDEQLRLGLEQGCDTQLPNVHLRKRFKPFVEDELPTLMQEKNGWVAHPMIEDNSANPMQESALLAIGPEGGFITYEVEKLANAGLKGLSLGPRILKVETAIPVAVTRLYPNI